MKNSAEPKAPCVAAKRAVGAWTFRLLLLLVAATLGGCATPLCPIQGRIGTKQYIPAAVLKKNVGAVTVFFEDKHSPPTEWRLINGTGPEKSWYPVARACRPGLEKERNAEAYGIEFRLCHPTLGVCAPEVRTITLLEEQILKVPIVYGPRWSSGKRAR